MERRAIVTLAALAGACPPVAAQEFIAYTLTWSEVLANSNQPVPTPNGLIEPGEGVRIAIRATITPGIGATAMYNLPPIGVGTIAGLGSMIVDLLGTNANGGTWANFTRNAAENPGGIPGGGNWALGGSGSGQPTGDIYGIQAGQFILPGMTANGTNPIENAWRGTWTPTSHEPRAVSFRSLPTPGNSPFPSIVIQYGLDANGDPQYVGKLVADNYGNTGSIPIVPAPGSLPLSGLALGLAARRTRRKSGFL